MCNRQNNVCPFIILFVSLLSMIISKLVFINLESPVMQDVTYYGAGILTASIMITIKLNKSKKEKDAENKK